MADDIAQWLEGLGLSQYAQAFADNDIDFKNLPRLTEDDLKELGFSIGHRRTFQSAIEALSGVEPPTRPASPPVQDSQSQPAEAERRQLTVMFCDLVGSTALSAQLDPEDMRDVIRAYQDACASVVARYEGFVAKYMGDGVLVYFGYPTAHEDDAERAINTGLGIVEAVKALERDLAVRVGVATGTVVVGDIVGEGASQEIAITGETPNLAARLQEIAVSDTVVIGEATHTLAGRLFVSSDLGRRELKGFAVPVGAWAVHRRRPATSRFEVIHGERLSELVGREEEVNVLRRRWERSKAGEGQVVLISGEPGIGKSRLAHTIRQHVAGDETYYRTFQCSPHHTNSAMFPFIEQVHHNIGLTAEDTNDERLAKLEDWIRAADQAPEEIAPVFGPALGIDTSARWPVPTVSPQRQKEILLEAFSQRLKNLAARQPVLYLVEDAHWIDPTSMELLGLHIERTRGVDRVLFVITYRPEFEAPWVGQPHTTLLTLNRLDRSQCAALAAIVGGEQPLSEAVIRQIADRTDGVPLFVEELTKAIVESGSQADGEGESLAVVPATLQDALEARLDRLGEARELAQIGAVIGRSFEYGLLADVSDWAEDTLCGALDRLVQSELVWCRGALPDAIYGFKHALVQDAAYNSLLRGRRQLFHGRIADCLMQQDSEVSGVPPELLAHHFTEAGRLTPAIAHWLSAGQKSMQRTATREAIGHLTRGLEVLSSQPASAERDRQELTLQSVLGSAMMYSHGWASQEAAQCYARARELCLKVGDDRELFPILFGFWMIHASRTELQEWRRTAAEMLQIARRHGDDAMLVQAHHASWGNPFQGDFLSQIGHVEQALKVYDRAEHSPLASQYGGHDAGVCGHGHKGIALWATGYPEQAAEAFFAARTLADQIAHPATQVHALGFSGWEQIFRNNWRETIRVLEEGIEIHKNSGSPQQRGRLHVMSGWARVALGDTAEGLKALRHGIAHERRHQSFGSGTLLAFNAEALRLAGLTAEALSAIDEAMPLMEERGERLWEANVHSLKGVLLLVQSSTQHADAEACFRTAIDIARDQSAKMWELRAVTRLARLRRTQGKSSEARDLLLPVYDWFTEGFDTADLKEAKALLDELS